MVEYTCFPSEITKRAYFGDSSGEREGRGDARSNYRLWGDDFIEVTPDPGVSMFSVPPNEGQASLMTVSRSDPYLYVVNKLLIMVFEF